MLPQRVPASSEGISRQTTQGFAQIPNSFVENLALVTHAESCLVMIACRRGENTISDKHWEEWTGLSARIKDHAIRGLREKGLVVKGRGKGAKYYFERDRWDSWVRSRPRRERAHTAGRSKSVTAKAGMQVHQECRERGCARLCEAKQSDVIPINSLSTINLEKQVSQEERRAEPERVEFYRGAGAKQPPPESSPPDPREVAIQSAIDGTYKTTALTALGNEVPNPYTPTGHISHLWEALKPALRNAQKRIYTSKNPKAYEARIIAAELARIRGSS